jgi:hypothetical protein
VAKNELIIEPVADVGTSNELAMLGSDGRRMFVASVPRAAREARMARREPEAPRATEGSGVNARIVDSRELKRCVVECPLSASLVMKLGNDQVLWPLADRLGRSDVQDLF